MAFGCIKAPPRFVVRPVITDSILKARLEFLDARYSADALCSDYRLLQSLIYYLHNDNEIEMQRGPCPRDYREFVTMSQAAQRSLKDLHTQIAFGNGLDAIKKPVVAACSGDDRCESMIGSSFFVVPTSVRSEFYGLIFSTTGDALPLVIDTVDGRTVESYKDEMDANITYSHTKGAWSQYLPAYVFERVVAADRSLNPLTVKAHSLIENSAVQLTLAYDQPQSIFPAPEFSEIIGQADVTRSYGCKEVLDPSDYMIGACVDQKGHIIVWLYEWPDAETMKQYAPYLAEWIEEKRGKQTKIFLDMRGNGGGSPIAVANFVCYFGDDNTLKIFDQLNLRVRNWPNSFAINGEMIETAVLKASDNMSIRQVDRDFNVGDGIDAARRERQIGFSERTMLTKDDCVKMRIRDSKDWKWHVFTNGNEFSSAENFLVFAKLSRDKFQVYGRPTIGGTGNPSWIALPKTNTGIRVSTARDYINGQVLIEKVGTLPDVELEEIETAEEFRARFTQIVKSQQGFDWGLDMRPKALRDIIDAP